MQVKCTLFKTLIDTNNTIAFENILDRETYFASLMSDIRKTLTIPNCSFNGKRNLRIPYRYTELIDKGFNYLRIELTTGFVFYCYIDDFVYINDNVSEIYCTIDYLTTYCNTVFNRNSIFSRINKPVIQNASDWCNINRNKKKELIYNNIHTVSRKEEIYRKRINPNIDENDVYIFVQLRENSGSLDTIQNVAINHYTNNEDRIVINNYSTIVFRFSSRQDINGLCIEKEKSITVRDTGTGEYSQTTGRFYDLLKEESENIIQISVVDMLLPTNIPFTSWIFSGKTYAVLSSKLKTTITISIPVENIDLTKFNSDYYELSIGRRNEKSILDINSFNWDSGNDVLSIQLSISQSNIAPYTYIITSPNSIDSNFCITLDSVCSSIPFTVNVWQDYLNSNSATVNDGLKTAHDAELKIAERNRDTAYANAAIKAFSSLASGAIYATTGPIGAAIGGGQAIGGASELASELIGADTAYKNTTTNIEKEKALLEIRYNDIKNTPNKIIFNQSSIGVYEKIMGVYVTILEASNINDINHYHKVYGYEVETKSELNEIRLIDMCKYNNEKYNYIVCDNILIDTPLQLKIKENIQKIFQRGIFLWSKTAIINDFS